MQMVSKLINENLQLYLEFSFHAEFNEDCENEITPQDDAEDSSNQDSEEISYQDDSLVFVFDVNLDSTDREQSSKGTKAELN